MQIEIEVIGGTHKQVRSTLTINGQAAGTLSVDRADFTKFCDLLFGEGYAISGKSVTKPL